MSFSEAELAYLDTQGIPELVAAPSCDPTVPPYLYLPEASRPPLKVLSPEDLQFFVENGYMIVRNAVPMELLDRLVRSVWSFLEMDASSPEDWYRPPLDPKRNGMVELYQSQQLWDIRQHPRVHAAFSDLFGTDTLWCSIDRVNVKLPVRPDRPEFDDDKGFAHWDLPRDLRKCLRGMPFSVQGVLSLSDTDEDMGGFVCAPGHTAILRNWIRADPAEPRPDMSRTKTVPIATKAGDLIIWSRLLFHGNGRNLSRCVLPSGAVADPGRPRMAMYVFMAPAPRELERRERLRAARVAAWSARQPLEAPWVRKDARGKEEREGKTAELTALGRKLLGLDLWPEADTKL
ncbi:hypothetical protein DFJ74DRAFT_657075 [Hyaloraphidium curvatum]|nr:hypothetical protein DFJ74DRAFT_657075 [Hyaloraphidium curvatum]